jgi:hypothetical protein
MKPLPSPSSRVFRVAGLALFCVGLANPATAQSTRDISREFRSPSPIATTLRSPPRPAQVCFFTGEKFAGSRGCFDPTERKHLGRPLNRTIRSFTVPYGYEVELYNDLILDAPDTPVELLCTFRQATVLRYTGGVSALKTNQPSDNGARPFGFDKCVGPKPLAAMTTQFAFRKITTITDAQRAAVWAGWEQNDNETCGVRIYPSTPVTDTTRIQPRSISDRVNCYGRGTDMSDLNLVRHGGPIGSTDRLKDDVAEVRIASRYGRIELFELPNFQGRHMHLGCGNYRLSTTMRTQIQSAFVLPVEDDTLVPATNCTNTVQTISSWNGPVNVIPQPSAPITLRP